MEWPLKEGTTVLALRVDFRKGDCGNCRNNLAEVQIKWMADNKTK
jgi:hypothetical protein